MKKQNKKKKEVIAKIEFVNYLVFLMLCTQIKKKNQETKTQKPKVIKLHPTDQSPANSIYLNNPF